MAIERLSPHEEIYHFLVSQPTPEQIIAFRPSQGTQERIRYLLDANRNRTLTAEEEAELNEFSQVEHFMRMLKLHARQKLSES